MPRVVRSDAGQYWARSRIISHMFLKTKNLSQSQFANRESRISHNMHMYKDLGLWAL